MPTFVWNVWDVVMKRAHLWAYDVSLPQPYMHKNLLSKLQRPTQRSDENGFFQDLRAATDSLIVSWGHLSYFTTKGRRHADYLQFASLVCVLLRALHCFILAVIAALFFFSPWPVEIILTLIWPLAAPFMKWVASDAKVYKRCCHRRNKESTGKMSLSVRRGHKRWF